MLAIRYIHTNCLLHHLESHFRFLGDQWTTELRFWSAHEAVLRRPIKLQEAFGALQDISKHQPNITNQCLGSILFEKTIVQ